MQKRREEAARNGFATGFDVTTAEERRKREERASRYGNSLIGVSSSDVAANAAAAAAAADAAAKRAARAAKFGADAAAAAAAGGAPGMELDVDFLEPRKDAAPDAPIRPDCVHLYGVDTMSTGDCMGYFGEYGPVFCEWINDSSCNIVFADAFTAKRAMVAVVRLRALCAVRRACVCVCAAVSDRRVCMRACGVCAGHCDGGGGDCCADGRRGRCGRCGRGGHGGGRRRVPCRGGVECSRP
jgi:hypothetical protein